jgi:hypothetical protein
VWASSEEMETKVERGRATETRTNETDTDPIILASILYWAIVFILLLWRYKYRVEEEVAFLSDATSITTLIT